MSKTLEMCLKCSLILPNSAMYEDWSGAKRMPDLVGWRYDIIGEETQAGPLAVLLEAPLNKQAGYHITNICLTPPQKVFCERVCRGGSCSWISDPLPAVTDILRTRRHAHTIPCAKAGEDSCIKTWYRHAVAVFSLALSIVGCSQGIPSPLQLPSTLLLSVSHFIQSSQVWLSLWDRGLKTWLQQREWLGQKKKRRDESMKGWGNAPAPRAPHPTPTTPKTPFLSHLQWDGACSSLPHISTSQRQALCFLNSLLKGKKCSPYQNKYGPLGSDHVS